MHVLYGIRWQCGHKNNEAFDYLQMLACTSDVILAKANQSGGGEMGGFRYKKSDGWIVNMCLEVSVGWSPEVSWT